MLKALATILIQAGREWFADNAPRLGAALAFYTIFAIAPLLVICTAIVGWALGPDATRGLIHQQAAELVGHDAAAVLETMIASAAQPRVGTWATAAGVVMMLFAAVGLFAELQAALNTIWNTKLRSDAGWWAFIKVRLLSLGMVLLTALILLTMFIASTTIAAISAWFGDDQAAFLTPLAGTAVSFAIFTVLFAIVYKVLPDAKIAWSDVLLGSVITALLFTSGNYAIGLYLGWSAVKSAYGAAGSLAVLLLWVYYATQVFLAGAEITQVYAKLYGSGIHPSDYAELIDDVKKAAR